MLFFIVERRVRCVVLYCSETSAVKEDDLTKMERNDMMMVRWMCNMTLKDKYSDKLRDLLGLVSIRNCIQSGRRWFGHVERMDKDSWVKKSREIVVEGHWGRGRPRKTWDEVTW